MRHRCLAAVILVAAVLAPTVALAQQAGTVRVGDVEMAYEIRGTGEPLLLLHGFGGCGQVWHPFVETLAKEYRVVVADLRGHGRSTNPSGVYTHDRSARDVAGVLDHLGLPRVKAMGISSGGMTLLHLATQQPDRITAMVLVGASSHYPPPARAIMEAVAAGELPAPVRAEFLKCASRGEAQAVELIRQFGAFKDSYQDMNFTEPYLGTIKPRTLIVHGDRDEFFPVEIPVAMYRAIKGSALWIVPNGDHVPIYGDRTREFLDVTRAFLRGAPRQ